MRRAYELAFATAHLFAGKRPRFVVIDRVCCTHEDQLHDFCPKKSRMLWHLRASRTFKRSEEVSLQFTYGKAGCVHLKRAQAKLGCALAICGDNADLMIWQTWHLGQALVDNGAERGLCGEDGLWSRGTKEEL